MRFRREAHVAGDHAEPDDAGVARVSRSRRHTQEERRQKNQKQEGKQFAESHKSPPSRGYGLTIRRQGGRGGCARLTSYKHGLAWGCRRQEAQYGAQEIEGHRFRLATYDGRDEVHPEFGLSVS